MARCELEDEPLVEHVLCYEGPTGVGVQLNKYDNVTLTWSALGIREKHKRAFVQGSRSKPSAGKNCPLMSVLDDIGKEGNNTVAIS